MSRMKAANVIPDCLKPKPQKTSLLLWVMRGQGKAAERSRSQEADRHTLIGRVCAVELRTSWPIWWTEATSEKTLCLSPSLCLSLTSTHTHIHTHAHTCIRVCMCLCVCEEGVSLASSVVVMEKESESTVSRSKSLLQIYGRSSGVKS